jgi:hypothetical protein
MLSRKAPYPLVGGASPFTPAAGPRYAMSDRKKPIDLDLHVGRRRRHDRPGAYGHSANESAQPAGGPGRHKMTSGLA